MLLPLPGQWPVQVEATCWDGRPGLVATEGIPAQTPLGVTHVRVLGYDRIELPLGWLAMVPGPVNCCVVHDMFTDRWVLWSIDAIRSGALLVAERL